MVLIQVPKGTPKTDAMLKPENTHETSHALFSSGAIKFAKVKAKEMIIPETNAVMTRETVNTV